MKMWRAVTKRDLLAEMHHRNLRLDITCHSAGLPTAGWRDFWAVSSRGDVQHLGAVPKGETPDWAYMVGGLPGPGIVYGL